MAADAPPPISAEPPDDSRSEDLVEDTVQPLPRDPFAGPWILKMRYYGFSGKHSAIPVEIEDVFIVNLGLDPENDPVAPETSADTGTAFIREDVKPEAGQNVDFETFRLACRPEDNSWVIIEVDSNVE